MADGTREREEWIETGRFLVERLQARLEDRIIDGDIEVEVANNVTNTDRDRNETLYLDTEMDDALLGATADNIIEEKKTGGPSKKLPKKKSTADKRDE